MHNAYCICVCVLVWMMFVVRSCTTKAVYACVLCRRLSKGACLEHSCCQATPTHHTVQYEIPEVSAHHKVHTHLVNPEILSTVERLEQGLLFSGPINRFVLRSHSIYLLYKISQ